MIEGRLQVAAKFLHLAESGVGAVHRVADAPVGRPPDLHNLAHCVGPEGSHLPFGPRQHVLAGCLDLGSKVGASGLDLSQERRPGGGELRRNGPRQRTGGPRCGV